MQASLELVDVKEEIEKILKEKHLLDERLEKKIREQNELTERCVRHIRVLKRKGMTGKYYCPKKRGITATPTKQASSHAPNYFPSPRSCDSKYVPPPQSGTPPQTQNGNMSPRGGLWSPIRTGQVAPCIPGCSPSRFASFQPMGGLLSSCPPTGTPQKPRGADAVMTIGPQDSKGKKSLIVKKGGPFNDGLSDKQILDCLKKIEEKTGNEDAEHNDKRSASGGAISVDTGDKQVAANNSGTKIDTGNKACGRKSKNSPVKG